MIVLAMSFQASNLSRTVLLLCRTQANPSFAHLILVVTHICFHEVGQNVSTHAAYVSFLLAEEIGCNLINEAIWDYKVLKFVKWKSKQEALLF